MMKWYPCIFSNRRARIDQIVGPAMSQAEAENFLKINYPVKWRILEAIPKREDHPNLADGKRLAEYSAKH